MIQSHSPAPADYRASSSEPKTMTELLMRLCSALRRYWFRSLLCFGVLMVSLLAFLIIVPRQYMSSGKFFVRHGRGGATLDPTATTSKNVHIQETRDAEINTVADVLGSRALLEVVVDEIGVDTISESHFFLSKYITFPELSLPSFSTASAHSSLEDSELSYDEMLDREMAIRKLESNLTVKASKKAATVYISVEAGTPKLAQRIVQLMMDRYLDMHIAARKTEGSQDFFQEQLDLQRDAMVEAQNAIRDFKNRVGITSIGGERNSIQMQLDKVEAGLIQVDADTAAAQDRIEALSRQYEGLDSRVVASRVEGNANEGADMLRNSLFELEAEHEELSARFHPTHPDVQAIRAAIVKAKSLVDEHPYDREEVTTAMNPTRMAIEEQLLMAKADFEGKAARRNALVAKEAALQTVLQELNRNEAELQLLERHLEIARNNHKEYSDKLEEARINAELDRDRISNVKIVQPATFVVKAVSPKRSVIFVLGAAFATFLSIGLAYFLDSADTTIRTDEDLAQQIDVPVLVTLPKSTTRTVVPQR